MAAPELQLLIKTSTISVAGLPCALRCAHRAAAELECSTIVFCGQDEGFARRFGAQLSNLRPARTSCANGEPAETLFARGRPLLVMDGGGFPEETALKDFLSRARGAPGPLRWVAAGTQAGVYYPDAAQALAGGGTSEDVARRARGAGQAAEQRGWVAAADEVQARQAEKKLLSSLAKDTDGYIARLDRSLSIAISRRLLELPITPNQITTASLALGLLGSWWLASGRYEWTLAGALLLWVCCLLDGCDGEVARLKLLCSPSGAAYDVAADHLAHLATFVAIPIGVHRALPHETFWVSGAVLVAGFLACVFSVWYLVLRKPESQRGPYALLIERVASRDYVYLIVALALIGRLDWFLYAAGAGSHVFWAALWLLPRDAPANSNPTTAACRTPRPDCSLS